MRRSPLPPEIRDNVYAQLLSQEQYAFASQAVPLYFLALTVAFLGVLFAVREHGSRVALPLVLLNVSGAVWLIATGIAYAAQSPEVTRFWLRVACAGLVSLPLVYLWLTQTIISHTDRPLPWRAAPVAIALALLLLLFATDWFVRGSDPTGEALRFGTIGALFVVLFVATMLTCARRFYRQAKRSSDARRARRRMQLLALSSVLGATISIGFLPALGVPIQITGHWFGAGFFGVLAYVTLRYRPTDITPAFVGAQISDIMTDALLVLDGDGIIRLANPASRRLLGRQSGELLGRHAGDIFDEVHVHEHIETLVGGQELRDVEARISTGSGDVLTVSVSASAVQDDDATPHALLFMLRDISSRKQAEHRIRELAYVDELTRLPNRADFHRRLHDDLLGGKDAPATLALLFLDLDRFKRINDTLGHDAGDRLLAIVAERLRHGLRGDGERGINLADDGSFIARLGGDEFVICLRGVDCREALGNVARRIVQSLSQPFDLGGQEVFVTTSIGISRYPHDGRDLQSLLKRADTAMYDAKEAGRDNFRFYDPAIDTMTRDRLTLESDLRKALDRDELELHFQPLVDHRQQRIVGAEALLRWRHPQRGMVPPAQFLPLAEETGAIAAIGEWALLHACLAARRWQDCGMDGLRVAVNLSARQFRRNDLLDVITDALAHADLPPRCLDLELTEGMVMGDVERSIATLSALKETGLRVSIDDFGTGYSSFNYLKRLPLDSLKVDGTFTRDMASNGDDAAITRAVIGVARTLRLEVIAEGIENEAQVAFLRRQDCHLMQGYLFGAPVLSDVFERRLRAGAGDARPLSNVIALPGLSG